MSRGCGRKSKTEDKDQRGTGKDDEEQVVITKGTEGRAGVRDEDEGEKIRDDETRLVRRDVTQRHPLRHLVEDVERERE